jgi:hypothetical protein
MRDFRRCNCKFAAKPDSRTNSTAAITSAAAPAHESNNEHAELDKK